jgi:hypothetical protein
MTSLLLKLTPAGNSLLEGIIQEFIAEKGLEPTVIDRMEVTDNFLDGLSDKQIFGETPIEIMERTFKMGEHITFINGGTV